MVNKKVWIGRTIKLYSEGVMIKTSKYKYYPNILLITERFQRENNPIFRR